MNLESMHMVVQVSAENVEQARQIARTVVERHLVACAQIFPIHSYYEWQGNLVEADEYLIQMKTRASLYQNLETCIKELHSYTVPEILALPVLQGLDTYLHWIDEVVRTP